jgi:hypothetical protein
MSNAPTTEERAQLKRDMQRARAFGLLLGAVEGLNLRLPKDERHKAEAIAEEARTLWDGTEALDKSTLTGN